MIIATCAQSILVSIGAEADHRQPAAQSVVDLSGIGPSQRRDGQFWPIEESPLGEVISQRGPVYHIETRILVEAKISDHRGQPVESDLACNNERAEHHKSGSG